MSDGKNAIITIEVGYSRKIGEPNYSSRGASVELAMRLDATVGQDEVREKLRRLFTMARMTVDEELRANGQPPPVQKWLPGDSQISAAENDFAQSAPDDDYLTSYPRKRENLPKKEGKNEQKEKDQRKQRGVGDTGEGQAR